MHLYVAEHKTAPYAAESIGSGIVDLLVVDQLVVKASSHHD